MTQAEHKAARLASMYGAGEIAVGRLCGQYPPPELMQPLFVQMIGRGYRINLPQVLDRALLLSAKDRASLIEALIDSLDDTDCDIEADMCDDEDSHDAEDTKTEDDECNGDKELEDEV